MLIEIREWTEEDAFLLHSLSMHPYFSKGRVLEYFYPETFLNAMSMIYFYQNADPKRFMFRAITNDNNMVGSISAQIKKEGSCELSYWIGVDYWKQGIMTKAVELMCDEIFQKLPVVCIYAVVDQKNKASQRILEKNQFQAEKIEHFLIYRKYK